MIELSTMFGKKIIWVVFTVIAFVITYKLDSNYPINNYSETSSSPFEDVFKNESDIFDNRIKVITVTDDNNTLVHLTRGKTPTDALASLGYRLGNNIRVVSTSPLDKLYNESYILLQTYNTELVEREITIPFETITKGSSLCPKVSHTIVEQEGELGKMKQIVELFYLGDKFISERIISQSVEKAPLQRILLLSGADDSPQSVTQLGPRCDYWEGVVNSLDATEEEKQWLRFTMRWESGCNAESNKSFYKGLFQWDPCLWYKIYPNDNIFDGNAQIYRTLQKVRQCADPAKMWPGVYKKYVQTYGELSFRSACGYL
jgi:hypothetical protein